MILPEKLLPVLLKCPGTLRNDTVDEMEITTISLADDPEIPVTALLSERALAKEWLKPEEDKAWDYL